MSSARFSAYLGAATCLGHHVRRHYQDLRAFYDAPIPEQEVRRRHRLDALIRHAAATVPWYRERLGQSGVGRSGPTPLTDLPIVTKSDLRRPERFLSESYRPELLESSSTGGSTGEVTRVYRTAGELDRVRAHALLQYEWMGLAPDCREVSVIGAQPDHRRRPIGAIAATWLRTRELNLSTIDDRSMSALLDALVRARPEFLWGYTSLLTSLARFVIAHNRRVPAPRVICNGAETMWEPDRQLIARAFGAPVLNRYGTTDIGVIGVECTPGSGLHIHDASVMIEIVRGGRPVPTGEQGEVVITQLDNHAMPLIRFAMGDLGRLVADPCRCGRPGLRLADLEGRTDDVLVATGGVGVPGLRVGSCLRDFQGITQFQLIQTANDRVEARIETRDWPDPDATAITQALGQLFGPAVTVDARWNVPFDLTPRYKFRRTIRAFPVEIPL